MAKRTRKQAQSHKSAQPVWPRSWRSSLFWATLVVGASIVASATINPLFGRSVHWDWMAVVAPVAFATLAIFFRRRWV